MTGDRIWPLARRAVLLLFLLWCLFPLYWMLVTALKKPVDVAAIPPLWVFTPTWTNFLSVWHNQAIWGYFSNSSIVAVGSTLLSLAFGIPVAYVLARHRFRGRDDFDFWVLSTRMAPPVATLIPFFVLYKNLGLLDTHLGLIIVHVGMNLAIVIWVLKSFFAELPESLEEAAFVDGAAHWTAFTRVILPLSWPGIVSTGILAFIFSWNEYLFALALTNYRAKTVPLGIQSSFIGYQEIRWGELAASSIFMLIPVLIVVLLFQRQLIRGLTFGAVK